MCEIISVPKTRITSERFKDYMPSSLSDVDIIINLGNSDFNDRSYYNTHYIVNKSNNIKNCTHKMDSLLAMQEAGVPCLEVMNLRTIQGYNKALSYVSQHIPLVLRKHSGYWRVRNRRHFIRCTRNNNYDYATKIEKNVKEWRIVLFKGNLVRISWKRPNIPSFRRKSNTCTFFTDDNYDYEIINICRQAQKLFNIDLCGIDILQNERGEYKIIEVNSGMSLLRPSIRYIYKLIKKEIFNASVPRRRRSFWPF